VSELLSPEPAARAGRAFGQVVSSGDGGALLLASARVIEQDVRATVLIVPGLFRIDLEPRRDAAAVHLRALTRHPSGWSAADEHNRGEHGDTLGFAGTFDLPGGRLLAQARIALIADDDLDAVFASSRATVRPA